MSTYYFIRELLLLMYLYHLRDEQNGQKRRGWMRHMFYSLELGLRGFQFILKAFIRNSIILIIAALIYHCPLLSPPQ
jgi:hypothetical protein